MDDVQELLKTTSNQTGESIADLRQRLGQKLEEGRRALSEQEILGYTGDCCRDRPGARIPHAPP